MSDLEFIAYAAAIFVAGMAGLIALSVVVVVPLLVGLSLYSRYRYWRYPPPDYTEIARRKLAGMRRRAFLERRARREAKRDYETAREIMTPERFREWANERSRRFYQEWAARQTDEALDA